MTPEEFKRAWTGTDDTLIPFSIDSIDGIGLSKSTIRFLVDAGLPDSAAPFLDFFGHGSRRLQPASDAYPIAAEYARYLCIGTNDAADPICIDSKANGEIVLLLHDDGFRVVRMNSSVEKLAESLLAYRTLVDETCKINGEDAFLDGDIPKHLIKSTTQQLSSIDPESMNAGDFWPTETETLFRSVQ